MFKMSAVCTDTSVEALAPLFQCVVNDTLVSAFPLLRNALLLLLCSPDLLPVDSLLELVLLQMADISNICRKCRTTFAVNAKFQLSHVNALK